MACACKSNNGAKKQVSQIQKRTANSSNHTVTKAAPAKEKKQVVIRRPVR